MDLTLGMEADFWINGVREVSNSPWTLGAVVGLITAYAIYCGVILRIKYRQTSSSLSELERIIPDPLSPDLPLYTKDNETSQNVFVNAWQLLLVHQERPATVEKASHRYLERHPSFYINADLLKRNGLDIKRFHRMKHNIYLIAIFLTFAGILLAVMSMVGAYREGADPQNVETFLVSVSLKFVASLVGIAWMVLFAAYLGGKEFDLEARLSNVHFKIISLFKGGFDLDMNVELNQDAKQLFDTVQRFSALSASLERSIRRLGESEIAKEIRQIALESAAIKSEVKKIASRAGTNASE